MAKTYAYAIVGGLIATFTVAPVLSALLLREQEEEKETLIVRAMRRVYDPAIRFALANRIVALGGMARCCWRRGSRWVVWVWNSCPSWRRAISGSAPRCPLDQP
jgi:hypothetical protein